MPLLTSGDRSRADRDRPRARPRLAIRRRPSRCCALIGDADGRPARAARGGRRARQLARAGGRRRCCSTSLSDPRPAMRAAALRVAGARRSRELRDGAVRARSRSALERARRARDGRSARCRRARRCRGCEAMLDDTDQRVIPSVLDALVKLKAPTAAAVAARAPEGRRSGRARGGGDRARRAEAGRTAPRRSPRRTSCGSAMRPIRRARRRWPRSRSTARRPRRRCSRRALGGQGLGGARARGAAAEAARSRPAPTPTRRFGRRRPPSRAEVYERRAADRPAGVDRRPTSTPSAGTIQIELAVLDAPLTVENFIALARKGYFNGLSVHRVVPDFVVQDGDPRGDGEGGPGYTIRDELNQRPYLRGTVGMALDWPDTGGSQFFITHSPQPHLDAQLHGLRPRHRGHGRRRSDSAVGRDSAGARLGRGDDDRR